MLPLPLPLLHPLGLADGVLCQYHLARHASLVFQCNRGPEMLPSRPSGIMTCRRLVHHNRQTESLLRIRPNDRFVGC